MHVVIFCRCRVEALKVSDDLWMGICDYVNYKTKHTRMYFEIDEKNIYVDIRPAGIEKAAGLRPDYVLFHENVSIDFIDNWIHIMKGRYTEIKTLEELIEMIIKE